MYVVKHVSFWIQEFTFTWLHHGSWLITADMDSLPLPCGDGASVDETRCVLKWSVSSGSFRFDFIDVYIYLNIHMQVHIMDIYFFCLYHRTFLVTIYSHRILDAHHYDHLLLLHVHICFRSYSFSLFPLHHHPHYFRHCQPIYLMYPNVIFCRHSITPSRIEDQYCW